MKIDFAGDKHRDEIYNMWKYCFGDSDAFMNWFFDRVYKSENTIAVFEGETVAANLQIFMYDINFCGKKCSVGYIAGVATLPEYRGRGYVKKLMHEAMRELYKRGAVFALLIPFRFEFYKPFGFEACYHLSEYSGKMQGLRPYAKAGGNFHAYKTAPIDIYNQYVSGKNGYIIRDEQIFREIYEDTKNGGGHFYILDEGGYIVYTIENGVFNALEIAYTGGAQLKSLLGFVYSHSSQADEFKIRCADDGFLRHLLCEKDITEIVRPHIQARVINAEKAAGLAGAPKISVLDDVIPENRLEGAPFSLGVGAFTSLVMGAMSSKEATALGIIDDEKLFFEKKENYANMLGWV